MPQSCNGVVNNTKQLGANKRAIKGNLDGLQITYLFSCAVQVTHRLKYFNSVVISDSICVVYVTRTKLITYIKLQ